MVVLRKVFNTTEVLTRRKLYGIYNAIIHDSITCHAPFTSRLISLSSVDTEEEEREFSTINAISKTTSNGHPEHIIPNCIVHAQAGRNWKAAFLNSSQRLENLPVTFHSSLADTVIPQLESELYQAHLETISDFLVWKRNAVARWWRWQGNCIPRWKRMTRISRARPPSAPLPFFFLWEWRQLS